MLVNKMPRKTEKDKWYSGEEGRKDVEGALL